MTEITLTSNLTARLVDSMGDDRSVVASARVSTVGAESVNSFESDANYGLINYLMSHRHGTPFEHNSMTFFVQAPIFVFREFHRHRIGWSYNEESGRYKQLDPVFYVPDEHRPLVNIGTSARPVMAPATGNTRSRLLINLEAAYRAAYEMYEANLDLGVAKEVSRACLPVGIYSSMWATCNARSLMSFLSLRTHDETATFPSYPQREIELIARQMEAEFAILMPLTYKAYCANGRVAP